MNPVPTEPNPPTADAVHELQEEVRSLRAILAGSLLVLNVLSFSLYVFLHNQALGLSAQAAETERAAAEFRAKFDPIARAFWVQLTGYSQTHPDFNPIMEKYRPLVTKAYPGTGNKPATTPAK
jgi:hypothetical protein